MSRELQQWTRLAVALHWLVALLIVVNLGLGLLAERMAINSVVQGSAADLIKLAMVDLHRRLHAEKPDPALADVLMLLQIHDELVFEAPETTAEAAKDLIVERMEAAMELTVPLKADAGISGNWFDAK